ncbi:MAG: endonuclease/exonuclease/phosphatase family protein [Prosthecobacter sp.]|jgi:endonuclease/exonuclease/phosphatase (EEP) superfamily protein YafD|uniref:endonuclease/exonuclease/phosphatase family protein n=1 Tax=Prosthecobacter sp. TaxID=1965333 RepID=UPI0019E70560|nr:endonuclease/exonuclease/phosphatase family protein [Prosthecobacter sp.]MBE2282960.1 endonuclease/exonuclease/phosphatase family protein [Prosthecobacter sp.]
MNDEAPPAERPSLFKTSVTFGGLCEVIAFLALTGTWLGSLGRLHWALDLFSHFRLPYLAVSAVVLIFSLLRRRTWLVAVALMSLLWNGQLIYTVHQTAAPIPASSAKPLRVMTFNIMTSNGNHVACIDHVLEADADIVCILEVDEFWRLNLEPLRVKYPHRVEEMNDGNFGIACYTRLPLKSSEVRRLSGFELPTVLLNLDYLGRPLTFIGTHPIPPMTTANAAAWHEQLSQISSIAASTDADVILAGDLNATPWCEGMRRLRRQSGLDFHCVDPAWMPTWGFGRLLLMPIDHVLVKNGLTITKRTIGPPLGSDHRSVTVEIVR